MQILAKPQLPTNPRLLPESFYGNPLYKPEIANSFLQNKSLEMLSAFCDRSSKFVLREVSGHENV